LGKVLIPNSSELFDEKKNEGKRMLKIIELNEMAFTKLELSINISNSRDKIVFEIVKSCKTKDMKTVILFELERS
jgi:hypothetical protein